MNVWIYVDTKREVGDRNHLQVFADQDAAEAWFQENDPEGVAFEYAIQTVKDGAIDTIDG